VERAWKWTSTSITPGSASGEPADLFRAVGSRPRGASSPGVDLQHSAVAQSAAPGARFQLAMPSRSSPATPAATSRRSGDQLALRTVEPVAMQLIRRSGSCGSWWSAAQHAAFPHQPPARRRGRRRTKGAGRHAHDRARHPGFRAGASRGRTARAPGASRSDGGDRVAVAARPAGSAVARGVSWNVRVSAGSERRDRRSDRRGHLELRPHHLALRRIRPCCSMARRLQGRHAVTTPPHAGCTACADTPWTSPDDSIAASTGAFGARATSSTS
jgi:hypothetical protein